VEPVTLKVWLVAPATTVTFVGTVAEAFELESVTTVPPAGATWLRVTVPVAVPPLAMVDGVTVNPERATGVAAATTVNVADLLVPPSDPVSVTGVSLVTAVVVTLKVAVVAPSATVTLAGTVAAALSLTSPTIAPPAGAA